MNTGVKTSRSVIGFRAGIDAAAAYFPVVRVSAAKAEGSAEWSRNGYSIFGT
jgi:hypothetical protein